MGESGIGLAGVRVRVRGTARVKVREAIGTRIILRFQELGIFLFMKHVIVQERT